MKSFEFLFFSLEEQMEGIRKLGQLLSSRKEGREIVQLHRLDDFFVEAYFDSRTKAFMRSKVVEDRSLLSHLYSGFSN